MGFWHDMEEQGATEVPTSRGPSIQIIDKKGAAAQAASQVYAELEGDQAVEEAAEELRTLSEVEKRLRKANYYRAILEHELFEEDFSNEASEVQAEFREFALKQLRMLMGIHVQEESMAASALSKEEVFALQILAKNILSKPGVMEDFKASNASVAKKSVTAPQVRTQPPLPPAEPKLKPLGGTAQQPVEKRPRGRPPGTGKHQIAAQAMAAKPEAKVDVPTGPQEKKYIEKEIIGPDGKPKTIKLDVSGPVLPQGAVQRAPPPVYSSTQLSPADMAAAQHAEQIAMNHPILNILKKSGE